MAAAGPLVTLVLIVACALAGDPDHRLQARSSNWPSAKKAHARDAGAGAGWLAGDRSTCSLLVFNLVPAFPLDGGRIARAAIWWRTGDRNRATRATGRAGQGFALVLGALGLWWLANGAVTAGFW